MVFFQIHVIINDRLDWGRKNNIQKELNFSSDLQLLTHKGVYLSAQFVRRFHEGDVDTTKVYWFWPEFEHVQDYLQSQSMSIIYSKYNVWPEHVQTLILNRFPRPDFLPLFEVKSSLFPFYPHLPTITIIADITIGSARKSIPSTSLHRIYRLFMNYDWKLLKSRHYKNNQNPIYQNPFRMACYLRRWLPNLVLVVILC